MTTTLSRYESARSRNGKFSTGRSRQGTIARKAQVKQINMTSYEVDPDAVAEAIILRLLAGRVLPKKAS